MGPARWQDAGGCGREEGDRHVTDERRREALGKRRPRVQRGMHYAGLLACTFYVSRSRVRNEEVCSSNAEWYAGWLARLPLLSVSCALVSNFSPACLERFAWS